MPRFAEDANPPTMTNVTLVSMIDAASPDWARAVIAAVLTAWGVMLLLMLGRRFHGTTLFLPWFWAVFSLFLVGAAATSAAMIPGGASTWHAPFRLLAAAATFCPCINVLGARRPHLWTWQLIVVSLWAMVALPAAEAFFFHGGTSLAVGGLRAWFLLILIFVGVVNWLPTRYWPSAILLSAGQAVLLIEHLPFSVIAPFSGVVALRWGDVTGLALSVAAATLVVRGIPGRRFSPAPLDRVWLDFRDAFGALWAARVAQRINAASAAGDWKITLTWSGFRAADRSANSSVSPRIAPLVQQSLENALRRFVSPMWIGGRLSGGVDE